MTALVRWRDDIPDGATALECPRCKIPYRIENDDLVEDLVDGGDLLRCLECRESGLIPRGSHAVADRFPQPLANDWTPAPNALFDRDVMAAFARQFGFEPDATDKAIILALERRRRAGREWVWPGVATIAADAGCAESSVKRTISGLYALEMLERSERQSHARRGAPVTAYNLRRFWDVLALLTDLPTTSGPTDPRSGRPRPRVPRAPHLRSVRPPKKNRQKKTSGEEPPASTPDGFDGRARARER